MEVKITALVVTCLLVGPFLSALIYKKQRLQFVNDLSVIFILKLITIFLALFLFYSQRPLLSVFAVDRVVIVQAHQLLKNDVPPNVAEFISSSNEPPLIAARLINSENLELIMAVLSGAPDIEFRPGLYERFEFQRDNIVVASAKWLSEDKRDWLRNNTVWNDESEQIPLPLIYGNGQYALGLVDLVAGKVVRIIDVNPW